MTATQTADDSPMSELTVVEFESKTFGNSYVSELSDGPPYTVHGVALGGGDVTVGQSGIKKKWPADELEQAADSLRGTNLVVDHNNDATGVVGRVTKSGYKEGTGVVYEAELYDEDLAEKIQSGLLEVSIRGYHADVDSLEEDEESDAKIVEDIEFDNLSIVPTGAAPSNTLEMGEHAELSAAELSAFTDSLEAAELQEIEPGMWVQSDGTKGITISQVQDGEIEVDIYEESDGKWRSTGETEMFDTGSLDEWDVDEDEDIGAPEEEDDSDEEESEDEEQDEEENAAVSQGDFVQWKGPDADPMFGQVVEINQDGQQFMATIRCFTESGEKLDMTKEKPLQALEPWDRMDAEDDTPDDMRDDSTGGIQAPTWEDGQMVKWQVNPQMKGKIVHVDREKKVLMVEVMEETEQGPQPTGYTLTAGFQDVVPMDQEMAATTTRDVPTQDAQPEHDTDSVNNLLKKFIEEQGDSQPSLSDFVDWMSEENLAIERGEGEEEILDSDADLDASHEGEPHRYIDADDEATELAMNDIDEEHIFKNKEDAQEMADELDLDGIHEMDGRWIPGATHKEYMDKVASTSAHGDDESEDDESDEEEMASREDMEDTLSIVNDFLDNEGAEDAAISEFLDWADKEPPVRTVVETFTNTVEDGSRESDVRALMEWLNGELTNDRDDENEEAAPPDDFMFESEDEARAFIEDKDGLTGVHEMDGMWMPGDDHSEFEEWHEMQHSDDEEASVDEGDTASDAEELEDYEMHTPDWSGTTESDWSTPDLEDFDTDDLGEVANHFLISSSGFPPENFTDLKLPVVEPNGDLSRNALLAVKGGRGASAVDGLSDEMEQEIIDWVNSTANEEFDEDWGEEEENAQADAHDSDTAGRPTPGENTVGGVRVLSGDDLQQKSYKTGESDADSLETYNITTMTSDIEEKLSELDEPVAVEAEEVEELRNKADRFEEMSENLEALRERTDILDEVDRSQVEELAESEDPVVEESARYEELQSEAEQVKGVYAAQLAEEYPAFSAEELTDKFSIEELREKFEEQIGDVEEELASSDDAEPRSQDADEESLEDAASEESDDTSEESLSDEAAAKQAEMKDKILGGRGR